MQTFGLFIQTWFCSAAAPQIERLLPRFLPKRQKASSEEHWVHGHIGFQNAVQLRLWIVRSCVCVFQSSVYNGDVAQ